MPKGEFGSKDKSIPSNGGRYTRLENKGESITFRLAGPPTYEGQHWLEEKREFKPCATVNNNQECEYCAEGDRPSIKYYFPIVNRETGEARIFQTVMTVKEDIDDNAKEGIDVYSCDWKVTRNETNPANYYGVVRLGNEELPEAQQEALEEAKSFDLPTGRASKSFPDDEEIDTEAVAKEMGV